MSTCSISKKTNAEVFKSLLLEDEVRQHQQTKERQYLESPTNKIQRQNLEQSIQTFWQSVGVLPPDNYYYYNNNNKYDDYDDTSTTIPKEETNNNNIGTTAGYNAYYWTRPMIPASLYRSPVSTPQTTLVDFNQLPLPIQTNLIQSKHINPETIVRQQQNNNKEEALIVEVPTSYLTNTSTSDPDDVTNNNNNSNNTSSLLSRRPVKGNLSDKLSEYTRGVVGQKKNQLFRPGGISTDEIIISPNKKNDTGGGGYVDQYRTPEAIERNQAVLSNGSKQSWINQTILTAPPNVNFTVGVSWEDVYGKEDKSNNHNVDKVFSNQHHELNNNFTDNDDGQTFASLLSSSKNAFQQQQQQIPAVQFAPPAITNGKGLFNRSYFDDDSLFGSSSSSSSSGGGSDDEEDESSDNDDEENNIRIKHNDCDKVDNLQSMLISPNHTNESVDENNIMSLDGDDIDKLLAALTIKDVDILLEKKMKRKNDNNEEDDEVLMNPLQLAERHVQNQTDTMRKSWASTKLLPIHSNFHTYVPNPAIDFPFTLDDFQQQAVARLERSESVFIAAHTSAGKTVVAEYAVALAMQRSTRCVYTSPIKALSNQKFRDFSLKFGSDKVGLITGDLQVNVDNSTCIIMTTEILRSMLYRGADLIRDIEWVIFDEVHYVNDTERGVVWEEVIIMLPSYVNLIFLSATTPNTLEFSDWIGRTKRKPVHVIKTNYRPVPLSHHLWAGNKLHKILEGKGSFIDAGYASAVDGLLPQSAKDPNKQKKGEQKGKPVTGSKELAWQSQGSKANWMSLVRFLDKEMLTPTVIFTFSKKKCEEVAYMLNSLDLNTAKERSAIMAFTIQTVGRLSQNDAQLPQVLTICEMVQRGIGVHHGGLLPILKEMVEILFSRNLIKVLFATETFAMGVNMPAKAVVFNSIRKHDGTQFRVLEPGEYTQMAGRAGRRGLDKVGTVIICCFGECPPPQPLLRQMLTGSSTKLNSQFRLTYNMILNLLKVEEMSVEAMIKRSFSEFATQRALTANEYPQLLARGTRTLEKLEEQFRRDSDSRIGAEDLEEYYATCSQLLKVNCDVFSYIREYDNTVFEDLFQPGRILYVTAARQLGAICSPAIVLRAPGQSSSLQMDNTTSKMVCFILMPSSYVAESKQPENKKPGTIGYLGIAQQRHYLIQEVDLDQIVMISSGKRRTIDTKLLLKTEEKGKMLDSQWSSFVPLGQKTSDPFAGMKTVGRKGDDSSAAPLAKEGHIVDQVMGYLIDSEKLELEKHESNTLELHSLVKRGSEVVHVRQLCDEVSTLLALMRSSDCHRHPNLAKYYTTMERKETLRAKVDTLRHVLSNESLQLFPDFLQRKAVLRKLGYVAENETVCVKGRVACEVNTCEELIATELVFEGLLNDLEPEEIAAVLSSLVYQEKSKDEGLDSELPEKLVKCCQKMKIIAVNLGQLQKQQGLDVDPGEYCDRSLNFGLVHVVYEWALGVPFKNICDLTDAQEGSIVRCITRLDELCREVRNCARVVGNPTLYRKLEAASTAIKRDIVFASSLYVS